MFRPLLILAQIHQSDVRVVSGHHYWYGVGLWGLQDCVDHDDVDVAPDVSHGGRGTLAVVVVDIVVDHTGCCCCYNDDV